MPLLPRLSIQSKLIVMLLLVCISSIIAIAAIAYSTGKDALAQATFNHLTSVRAAKRSEIESQFQLIRSQVINLSSDPAVVECMLGLRANFDAFTDADVKAGWDEKLLTYYRDDFLPKLAQNTGKHPLVDSFLPRGAAARYLQYWYLANNPHPTGQKDRLLKADDGSAYSTVHARFHPMFSKFVHDFGYDNLFLIDNRGDVVYTLTKSPAFATNLLSGPYSNTNVAEMFRGLIGSKDQDATKLVDFMRLDSALGKPVALIGAPIFDGPNQIGVLAIQLPTDEINRVMTGNFGWEQEGLGKTGEAFLVGSDLMMRSRSRLLWQDKPRYFEQLERAGYSKADMDQVRRAGTALLAQYVRMPAVANALSGNAGLDVETDYRGQPALVSYAPVEIEGVRWVMLATMEKAEAFEPLTHLTRMILCWSVLIVLAVTILAAVLAHHFVRPIYRLAEGVKRFKAGKTEVAVHFASEDEYRDLGAAFNEMTQRIDRQSGQLSAQERRNRELLLSLAPPSIASRLANGERNVAERHAEATVLVARVCGFTEATASLAAEAVVGRFNELISAFDEAAERRGVEKLKTSGYGYLAVCGVSEPRLDHSKRMVEFAREISQILARFAREHGLELAIRIALNAGPLTGGVVGRVKFTYDLFGETVDRARALLSQTQANAVLVSQSVYEAVQDLYGFEGPLQVGGGAAPAWALQAGLAAPARGAGAEAEAEAALKPAGGDPGADAAARAPA